MENKNKELTSDLNQLMHENNFIKRDSRENKIKGYNNKSNQNSENLLT